VRWRSLAGGTLGSLSTNERDLGLPSRWRELSDLLVWTVIHDEAPVEFLKDPRRDPDWEWAKAPEVREAVRPRIAETALVASFLATEGLKLTPDANALFVDAVSDNLLAALALLERHAEGDYSKDQTPARFPVYERHQKADSGGMDPWQLWEAFLQAASLADNTITRWRAVFLKLKADFPGRSAASISEDEARVWITGLVGEERTADTVKSVWIPASRRVFGWAKTNRLIPANPFAGATVERAKKTTKRHKWFKQEEWTLILSAALDYKRPKTATERARRWVPWLCAYSGARAGEITQLRGIDVGEQDGVPAMMLTPEAGTIKTREARWVPLHEHLIAQGFLKFVAEQGPGPLFYEPAKKGREQDKLNPRRTPPQNARAKISEWTRDRGITDDNLSPTHAWRHTFQRICDRSGILEKYSDAITGHKPATVGRGYGAPSVGDMAEALKKFPRYEMRARKPVEDYLRQTGNVDEQGLYPHTGAGGCPKPARTDLCSWRLHLSCCAIHDGCTFFEARTKSLRLQRRTGFVDFVDVKHKGSIDRTSSLVVG
jgi:integrase